MEYRSLIFQVTSSNILNKFSNISRFIIVVLSPRCSFYITSRTLVQQCRLLSLPCYSIICGLSVIHFWYVAMLNSTQDPSKILQKTFDLSLKTSIARNSIASNNFVKLDSVKRKIQFISLT